MLGHYIKLFYFVNISKMDLVSLVSFVDLSFRIYIYIKVISSVISQVDVTRAIRNIKDSK